jgi:putative tryptophan/tyrosine transport system substrate-binding protein
MRRRDFIGALVLMSVAESATAQRATGPKRVAWAIPAGDVAEMRIGGNRVYAAFLDELQRLGYVEGQNLVIQRYSAAGNMERYTDLAREIVNIQPDVIVTSGTPLTRRFKEATSTIPIVTVTGDPVRFGLVTSIARPGGNITGVSVDAGVDLWGKRLELLIEAVPSARTVLFVSTPGAWDAAGGRATRDTAQKLGTRLISAPVVPPVDAEAVRRTFEAITRDQADGIMFAFEGELTAHQLLIVELVQRIGIPAIYVLSDSVRAGGLMSYSDDIEGAFRFQAKQTAEVLRGGKPAEMPYVQASRFELAINLKTAKAIGLEIPPTLLARADTVIE